MTSRLLPVVFILIAIGLFFGYANPTYSDKVRALRSEIRSYDAALAAAKAYEEKEAQIIEERANLPEGALDRVEAFLPDGVDNVQLILDLDALGNRSGLSITDFDVAAASAEDGDAGPLTLEGESPVESLEIGLTGAGSYASFKTFMEGVEWSLRPLDLVSLSIEDSDTGVYTYDMVFRIYWLR